jgi:hypothetical protein
MMKNSNHLFKQQFLMHPNKVLHKISVIEYSYQSVNEKNLIVDKVITIYKNFQ